MKTMETIAILEKHKDNLAAAKTFEEYRDAHVSYVQMLIDGYTHDLHKQEVRMRWVSIETPNEETPK